MRSRAPYIHSNLNPTPQLNPTPHRIQTYTGSKRLIVLAGASMGAYATWDLLACAPATFAIGIPMSGGGDTKLAARVTARVWAFHGIPDRSVPVNASREIVDAVAATRSPLLNVSWATDGRTTTSCGQPRATPRYLMSGGRTNDVAVGLRYTEFPHAQHTAVVYPLFDKGVAEPLFEWTLQQVQAVSRLPASIMHHKYKVGLGGRPAKKSPAAM